MSDCVSIEYSDVLTEMEQKRQQHIQELISTEETFAKDLATVTEVCRIFKPGSAYLLTCNLAFELLDASNMFYYD